MFLLLLLFLLAFTTWSLLILRFFCELLLEFYAINIRPVLGTSVDLKRKYGEWAIITGATDGIGKGYAYSLAARGLNLVLVSRNDSKLNSVIHELEKKFPEVQLKKIVHDFSKVEESKDVTKFERELNSISSQIGLLVNNVGTTAEENFGRFFLDFIPNSLDVASKIIQVNINSVVLMTSIVLPVLVKNGRGIIINISSISAIHPQTGNGTYAATKAFVDSFSRSIKQETRATGIQIQTVYPSYVKTPLVPEAFRNSLPTWIAPEYIPFTENAVKTIGLVEETYGCLSHRLQAYLYYMVKAVPSRVGEVILSQLVDRQAAILGLRPKKIV